MRIPFLCALLVTASTAALADETENAESKSTRFGDLQIRSQPEAFHHTLHFAGKQILEYGGDVLKFFEKYEVGSADAVIVVAESGGIGCPYETIIVEIDASKAPRASEKFGCLEIETTKVVGNKLIVEIPAYVPHPELLTEAEVEIRERTTEVFTWSAGELKQDARVAPKE